MKGSLLSNFSRAVLIMFLGFGICLIWTGTEAEEIPPDEAQAQELMEAREALRSMEGYLDETQSRHYTTKSKRNYTQAEAFVAGPDWEFDGFVAGGQDSQIKSMFVLNDLIYLNIGRLQNVEPGDRYSIYRRGKKVRDPQTGRFLGYEVRRAAITEVTNQVDDEAAAARIMKTFEGVEIGDLVRRD